MIRPAEWAALILRLAVIAAAIFVIGEIVLYRTGFLGP
jgi:hypothetical protein